RREKTPDICRGACRLSWPAAAQEEGGFAAAPANAYPDNRSAVLAGSPGETGRADDAAQRCPPARAGGDENPSVTRWRKNQSVLFASADNGAAPPLDRGRAAAHGF